MAIVIKGMEMPKTCEKCKFNYLEWIADTTCICLNSCTKQVVTGRMDDCPLVEIPDALVEKYQELMKNHPDTKQFALLPFQKGEDK